MKSKYSSSVLEGILRRDAAVCNVFPEVMNGRSIINFHCKCGACESKTLYALAKGVGALCKKCTNEKKTIQAKKTCIEKYGVENPFQVKTFRAKAAQTCIIRYGVENPFQSEACKKTSKETCMRKYGVENPFQSEMIKDKFKRTSMERYGTEHPFQTNFIQARAKKTFLAKYGVENPFQSDVCKEKSKLTCLQKYGVESAAQALSIQEKTQRNAKKYKDFVMPSGLCVKVQGYEPFALRDLIEGGHTEAQIKVGRSDIPRIPYTVGYKVRYHFPDIWLPEENKFIEVKSTWTYKCKADNVLTKKEACEALGHKYEIWIYDHKGKRTIVA